MALATRSIERSGTRGEVYLSDPWEATAAVHNAGYPHLHLLGDRHSHTIPGSELPSLQDAKAWAGTMDSLARDACVSLLVSPSEELGWMTPKFQPGSQGAMACPRGPWSDGLTSTDGESPAPAEARAHAAPRPVDDGGGDRDVQAGSGCPDGGARTVVAAGQCCLRRLPRALRGKAQRPRAGTRTTGRVGVRRSGGPSLRTQRSEERGGNDYPDSLTESYNACRAAPSVVTTRAVLG